MRGHHKRYIDEVNARTLPFYVKESRNNHVLSRDIDYILPDGRVYRIGKGTSSNLFSCVPDTSYVEFHYSAFLHDVLRADPEISREYADYCFLVDMLKRVDTIRTRLLEAGCPVKVVEREVIRLSRVACLYMLGVSGKIGSLYIWLDKIF